MANPFKRQASRGHIRPGEGHVNTFTKYVLTHNCADPWFMLAETFVPAFLELVWTISVPDWEDVLRDFAEKYERSGRLPGLGNVIKGHGRRFEIPVKKGGEPFIRASGLRITLWLTQPIETIGYAMLLYNATGQFWGTWQTLLMQQRFCTDDRPGPLQRKVENGGWFFNSTQAGAVLPIVQQNRDNWATNSSSVTLPPGAYIAIFSCNVHSSFSHLAGNNCWLWLRVRDFGVLTYNKQGESFSVPPAGDGDAAGCCVLEFRVFSFSAELTWGQGGDNPVGTAVGDGHVAVYGVNANTT